MTPSLASSTAWPLLMAVVVSMAVAASPAQARKAEFSVRRAALDHTSTGWKAAQDADRVVALPGQPPVNFAMYAGYITVNKEAGRAHYYYFVEAAEEPEKKPLVIWYNGGPGCSSIAYGFGEELGPFFINLGGENLRLNPNAGNRLANMLFVESPAGVGFSYSNTSNDLITAGDNRTAHDNYAFVVNWMERFPQYKGRTLYLTGESYAGFYVPKLSKLIYKNNKKLAGSDKINFQGFMLGNPKIDRYYDKLGLADYLYYDSLISEQLYNQIKIVCNLTGETAKASDPDGCFQLLNYNTTQELGNIDRYSIYAPACTNVAADNPKLQYNPGLDRPLLAGYDPCTKNYAAKYFNRPDVQKAMHANTTGIPYPWSVCNSLVHTSYKVTAQTMLPIYRELLQAGFRLWVFSGDVDAILPTLGTRYSLASLNLPVVVPWYSWYNKLQVGGREIVYHGNLTLVTVRGAGHEVPLLKPEEFLSVFGAFLKGSLLPRAPY